jgi:SAM-dependent methyltransferase
MQVIRGDASLLARINADDRLAISSHDEFEARYDDLVDAFYSHFDPDFSRNQIENCIYHKGRYIAMAREPLDGTVVDVGNDKPFLSFFLRQLHKESRICTVSFDIPQTPYDLFAVDIENEALPCLPGTVDKIVFAEVLEHLWRDPAKAVYEMNRALRVGGEVYVPNACELHAITCILWQANPNQRNRFYPTLESGHLHLWTGGELRNLFESNGFEIVDLGTFNPYGYTALQEKLVSFVREVTPHFDMMGESLIMRARKTSEPSGPQYASDLFPSGKGVQFAGALRAFALKNIAVEG